MPSIPIFCNPGSGSGSEGEDELAEAFDAAGIPVDLRPVEPADLADRLRKEVEAGQPSVGVSGGDGTISSAANVLAGTGTALVVCPGGTLNHFAVAMGVDTYPAAAEAAAARRWETVDVGEVNDRVFVNGVSIGLYPRSLRIRKKWEPRLGKWGAAALAAVIVLSEVRQRSVRLEGPGLDDARLAPLVWVGPGEGSFGSPKQKPRSMDSGTLELVVLQAESAWRLLRLAFSAFRHGGDALRGCSDTPECRVHHLESFTLHAQGRSSIDLGIDGELVTMDLPLRFQLRAGALRVARGERNAGEEPEAAVG